MTTDSLTDDERRLFARVSRRIIPFMILLYTVSFLDRVNVGFAALAMNADLGFTPTIFGWGVGIFFIGYFIFEVPSNVVIEKVGARFWICRIMVTWGLISGAMAFVSGPMSFYVLRFLLGAAEAGFSPGMILYLTYWFPAELRARYLGLYLIGIPLASVVGGPLSSYLLGFHGLLGLAGWQWLFLIEAVPALLLGIAVLRFLPDGPAKAHWLSGDEKARIARCLAREREARHASSRHDLRSALKDARVLLMSGIYFGIVIGLYGTNFWLPQIVKGLGFTNIEVGWIAAAVYLVGAVAMPLWGRSSDRNQERVWHTVLAAVAASTGLLGAACFSSPLPVVLSIGLAAVAVYASLVPFWALPPTFLSGAAAAAGIALINSLGNLGGFAGPYLVGWIKETTQSYSAGMLALAAAPALAALLMLIVRLQLTRGTAPMAAE